MVAKTLLVTQSEHRRQHRSGHDEQKSPHGSRFSRNDEHKASHGSTETLAPLIGDAQQPPDEEAPPEAAWDESAWDPEPFSRKTFIWNSRPCNGNMLHKAALTNNFEELSRILEVNPSLCCSRFTYQTLFNGQPQEGSGEAIHIAASRGSKRGVELLLAARASVNTYVTRDHKDHYNVLHSAVFAEGRGGTERMVTFLLAQGAVISSNLDGRWPLHLAFQTGKASLIPLLRGATAESGVLDEVEGTGAREPTPLMLGIQMRKLGEEQLAEAASLTAESLAAFIHHEPKCIPSFLMRMARCRCMRAAELAQLIKAVDLPKVITECPEAAEALLTALTETPECESEGWHPLPSRVSFAPQNIWQRIQDMLNPERHLICAYVPDQTWKYNTTTFKEPDWHAKFTDTKCCRPIRDVRIKVCHVADLACADFLTALTHIRTDDHLYVYQNTTVRCVLDTVWWQSAIKVDVLNVLLSIWGLTLLVLDTVYYSAKHEPAKMRQSTSTEFIAARAVVDLGHELAQVMGLVKIRRGRDYMDWGNAYDLFRCALPAFLYIHWDNRVVRILVILVYWMRILEVNFAESLARELLPIVRLANGLGPASIVAFIGFCGLTHAFCALGDYRLGSEAISRSFQVLITGDIIEGSNDDKLQMILTYVSVLLFTVFFLNIFIGVIGENYSIQKAISPLIFQKVRAGICSTYLLRASVIPGNLCPASFAGVASLLAGGVALVMQTMRFSGRLASMDLAPTFTACQLVMFVACYQNPNCPWSWGRRGGLAQGPHYLWVAEASHKRQASQLDRLEAGLGVVRDRLSTTLSQPGSPQSDALASPLLRPDPFDRWRRSPSISSADQ